MPQMVKHFTRNVPGIEDNTKKLNDRLKEAGTAAPNAIEDHPFTKRIKHIVLLW